MSKQASSAQKYQVDRGGYAAVLLGATLYVIAAFLPLDQAPTQFQGIASNTLVESGYWWMLIVAVGTALVGYNAMRIGRPTNWLFGFGIALGFFVEQVATDKTLRTLYPIGANGQADASQPGTVAQLGVAVYVAGLGALLVLVGAWLMEERSMKLSPAVSASAASEER